MKKQERIEWIEKLKGITVKNEGQIKELQRSLEIIKSLNENGIHDEAIKGVKGRIGSIRSEIRRRDRTIENQEYRLIHGEPESIQLYRHETGGL